LALKKPYIAGVYTPQSSHIGSCFEDEYDIDLMGAVHLTRVELGSDYQQYFFAKKKGPIVNNQTLVEICR